MGYAEYIRELLRPLRVYALSGGFEDAETEAVGACLDLCEEELEETEREMSLCTAEHFGLEKIAQLLRRRPLAGTAQQLRTALAALLRIAGDSFTLATLNDTLCGCGINAVVRETENAGTLAVMFPNVAGIPRGFEEIQKIIEDILPCHLAIEYLFWYITWTQLEEKLRSWSVLEEKGFVWSELEAYV